MRLVEALAKALGTHAAWVTEYVPERESLRALAFWVGGSWMSEFEHAVPGTPCEIVIRERRVVHFPDRLTSLYPNDRDVTSLGVVSYLGFPLCDTDDRILGHLAVMDTKPMEADERARALFSIFASRASAELRRVLADRAVREREEKLRLLIDSAMDAIVELDAERRITRLNRAAEKVFGCETEAVIGTPFERLLEAGETEKLDRSIGEVESRPEGEQALWLPRGLAARRLDGTSFAAETTLSRYHIGGRAYFTLILRNVEDRLAAERQIRQLTDHTEYLRQEILELHNSGELVGRSPRFVELLRDLDQVAPADTSVLLLGETGTGKELIARAIHATSRRRGEPLIKVNCAAIPATLIESEFFGHERGAFTGATARRDGRFALADGGTIFLDEIGELPLELQAKLLRVLQEGEFEPVGSSETRRVDVRVIAATNRDLLTAARDGRFREDLYYRLAVFPLQVPALRERREDIAVLAASFVERFATRLGKRIEPLTPACIARLESYPWPGNVRELMNVIERGVILARDGRMDLTRTLPELAEASAGSVGAGAVGAGVSPPAPDAGTTAPIRTIQDLEALERDNLLRALDTAGWRVAGENGAAALLGTKPSTLSSRMKALGIQRPRG
ncbi:MAG: sigma 54-interacting transcriptional regulator [Deltaproteobacteria bacterium]|nr:sigma 54-interacting transcriptional regulator [Deltaproteobacteria bacterium]